MMARQAGPHYITGTIGELVFYKLGAHYYVRQKGKPTAGTKKRLKDKNCYPVLNLRKGEFGQASQLAKEVYRFLPRALRGHGVQQKLTGIAVRMLRQGMAAEEIKALLQQSLQPVESVTASSTTTEDSVKVKATPNRRPTSQVLSNWQVQERGILIKERNGAQTDKRLVNKPTAGDGRCDSCQFTGWPSTIRSRSA